MIFRSTKDLVWTKSLVRIFCKYFSFMSNLYNFFTVPFLLYIFLNYKFRNMNFHEFLDQSSESIHLHKSGIVLILTWICKSRLIGPKVVNIRDSEIGFGQGRTKWRNCRLAIYRKITSINACYKFKKYFLAKKSQYIPTYRKSSS